MENCRLPTVDLHGDRCFDLFTESSDEYPIWTKGQRQSIDIYDVPKETTP
jgi:hypothetical protein